MKKHLLKRNSIVPGLTRRRVLDLIGGMTTLTLLSCVRQPSASSISSASPTSTDPAPTAPATPALSIAPPTCVVRPQQTEGPYFVDERLDRSDIRSDPANGAVKAGTPLQLVFQVSQINNRTCTPISNAIVDIWHCDAEGIYSDVNDRSFNTVGQKFLRGYQVTDTNGVAQFTTIYPGWYPGRTVHIHFKIRTDSASQPAYEFTSQLYFDDALTDQVYTQSPYAARGERNQRSDRDGIFGNGGEQLLLQVTPAETGYAAKFDIGLEFA